MSSLRTSIEQRATQGSDPITYVHVQLEGFIDAANYPLFEKTLEKLLDSGRFHIVLDFKGVEYINSTGISGIIRFHHQCASGGGVLVLSSVARNVGITMHLLGVTSVVSVAKDVGEAEKALKGIALDAETGTEERKVPVMAEKSGPSGTVALLLPRQGNFANICKKRVEDRGGKTFLYSSPPELLQALDTIVPDLVVIDQRIPGSEKLVERIKLMPRHTLASIILIHPRGSEIGEIDGFRVWENDSLVDPFDLGNLFILAESEIRRVSRDRKLFTQQVRFQFDSERDSVEQGLSLGGALISKLPLTETEKNALQSALKEGVDNAVRHGNKESKGGRVTVNYVVDPRRVTMLVEDEGDGFDHEFFLSQIEEKDAFDRAKERMREGGRGGLGILLMHRCSDRLEYLGKGNVVRIEKALHR
ncbi:MAG: ATP-binding protein [Planctomycetota bacterium]|nr:ATP-binding protein [Planctomycetota bacterium]